jgi:uncharacterized repeat protein (TIGR01451 family)
MPDEGSLAGDWRPVRSGWTTSGERTTVSQAEPARASVPAARVEPAPRTTPPAKPAVTAAPAPAASGDGWVRGRLAYPTGDPATSAILLEKSMPSEVIAGKPYEYEIKVTNISRVTLDNVEVDEAIPAALKIGGDLSGDAKAGSGGVKWTVGNLAPGASKSLRLSGTPAATGEVGTCSSVKYSAALCMATNVVSPALKLILAGPAEVMVCDEIPYKLTVTNSGSGMARNVKIETNLPEGMTTVDGRRSAVLDVGTLAAGESKNISLNTKVSKTGQYANKAMAMADNGLTSDAAPVTTIVRQPVLAITKTGPEKQFLGRPVTYEIAVTNKGDGVARDTVIVDALPGDARFESATEGGRQSAGKVQWSLGELAPGQTKKVNMTVTSTGANVLRSQATAQARCADAVTAAAQTTFAGLSALLLECVDTTDPLEIGGNQTYVITVTNQGSAPDTNIKIVANLEDTMEFVSASGQTRGSAQGKTVTFEPLPSLAPKAKATWQVVVKSVGAGDVRFKVNMTADQLTRPVEETESSNFYK